MRRFPCLLLPLSLFLFLLSAGLCSCGRKGLCDRPTGDTLCLRHATLLRLILHEGWREAVVMDPWHEGKALHRYLLVRHGDSIPSPLPQGTIVRVPLRRSVVLTAVHAAAIRELGQGDAIAGMADTAYVLSPGLKKALGAGHILSLGDAMRPNMERLLTLSPDAVLLSPFEGSGGYGALESAEVPLIECADYMERTPLGRAEWIKFLGMLYGQEEKSDSLFQSVETHYNALLALTKDVPQRPTVMADMLMGDAWYVPGGESTIGQMIRQAGGDYIFDSDKGAGGRRLSLETVYLRAREADVWLLKYGKAKDWTYATLAQENTAYRKFRPWKQRRIYHCNTLCTPFFEDEPFHPDRLLGDLIHIFHPDILNNGNPAFYHPLK